MADTTEMSSRGKSIWILFGGVLFMLLLAVLFLIFSGSNLRRRWGKGNFSGRRADAISTFIVS